MPFPISGDMMPYAPLTRLSSILARPTYRTNRAGRNRRIPWEFSIRCEPNTGIVKLLRYAKGRRTFHASVDRRRDLTSPPSRPLDIVVDLREPQAIPTNFRIVAQRSADYVGAVQIISRQFTVNVLKFQSSKIKARL